MSTFTFGTRMKLARTAGGMSAADLVNKANLNHVNHVYRYEGGHSEPSLGNAVKIAIALGVSLDYLTGLSDGDDEMKRRLEILQQIEELKNQL